MAHLDFYTYSYYNISIPFQNVFSQHLSCVHISEASSWAETLMSRLYWFNFQFLKSWHPLVKMKRCFEDICGTHFKRSFKSSGLVSWFRLGLERSETLGGHRGFSHLWNCSTSLWWHTTNTLNSFYSKTSNKQRSQRETFMIELSTFMLPFRQKLPPTIKGNDPQTHR